MHEGFHGSSWTDQETGIAVGHNLLVIAVELGETPYRFLGRYQTLPGRGKSYDKLAGDLFDILRTNPLSRMRLAVCIVQRFAQSESFDDAKRNMTLIEQLSHWDPTLSQQARQALKENGQVAKAFGVQERLEAHIRKLNSPAEIPF